MSQTSNKTTFLSNNNKLKIQSATNLDYNDKNNDKKLIFLLKKVK